MRPSGPGPATGQVLAHHLEGEVAAEADAQPGQQRRDAGAEEERQRSRSPGGKRQHGGDQQRAVAGTAESAEFCVDKEREGGEADEEGGHRRGKDVGWRGVLAVEHRDEAAQPEQRQACQHHGVDEDNDPEVGRADIGHVDEAPEARAGKGGRDERAPAADARDRGGRRQHHREIDEERPVAGRLRRNQQRRGERAEEADAGQRLAVDERENDGAEPQGTEQQEGKNGADEAVERMGRIDRAEQDKDAGSREDGGNVGTGGALDGEAVAGAADELAADDQNEAEQRGEHDARGGTKEARLDGIAHEKQPAQRERDAADPDRPARAERGLDVGFFCRWRRGCRRRTCRIGGAGCRSVLRGRLGRGSPGTCGRGFLDNIGSCFRAGIRGSGVGRRGPGLGAGNGGRLRGSDVGNGPWRGLRQHERAQRADLAFEQADAAVLARHDHDEADERDQADKAEQAIDIHPDPLARTILSTSRRCGRCTRPAQPPRARPPDSDDGRRAAGNVSPAVPRPSMAHQRIMARAGWD